MFSEEFSPIGSLEKRKFSQTIENIETSALLENYNKQRIKIQPQHHNNKKRQGSICLTYPQQSLIHQLPNNEIKSNSLNSIPTPVTFNQTSKQIQLNQQNDQGGTLANSFLVGAPIPKIRRFENFLMSIVGRKPSKEVIAAKTTNFNLNTNANTASTDNNNSISNNDSRNNKFKNKKVPLLSFPKINLKKSSKENLSESCRISLNDIFDKTNAINYDTKGESIDNYQRRNQISRSTLSLNSVQQKLWNVVPLLRRERSIPNFCNEKFQSIVQYTSGLQKCETVLSLSRKSSGSAACNIYTSNPQHSNSTESSCSDFNDIANPIDKNRKNVKDDNEEQMIEISHNLNYFGQIKPLNRLRTSTSTTNANCSRCSSLLSLTTSGSRYSLNIFNNGLLSINKNSNPVNNLNASTNNDNLNSRKNSNNSPSNNTQKFIRITNCESLKSIPFKIRTDSSNAETLNSTSTELQIEGFICKLCLSEIIQSDKSIRIEQCGCSFCAECMKAYVEFEISEGAYEISCPDAQCPSQGILNLKEITALASSNLLKKYHQYRLNREIELDKNRTWCPKAGCETICLIMSSNLPEIKSPTPSSSTSSQTVPTTSTSVLADACTNKNELLLCAVHCPTCGEEFCSTCKKPWHPYMSCEDYIRQDATGVQFDNDLIKCCPMCTVPIEKDEGCAQMMCKRCKHVFCWYCLSSLDDDFLLRHYDKGPCKNKLGHSRASVVWHRAQVIGIFAGFGILLLVASPLLLLAAPCIICCKCRICNCASKIDDPDTDFDEVVALQR